ncbi:MAG: GGDEF domain-containing protein [Kiritimatiellae bacterium]|nr:GGDEF domain-containing protein [Kiritimatiellia bacterium]
MKRLLAYTLPVLLLGILLYVVLIRMHSAPRWAQQHAVLAVPGALFALASVLAAGFRRTGHAFAAALLGATFYAVNHACFAAGNPMAGRRVLAAALVWAPLDFALFHLLRAGSPLSPRGLLRFAVAALQSLMLLSLAWFDKAALTRFVQEYWPGQNLLENLPVHELSAAGFCLAGLVLVVAGDGEPLHQRFLAILSLAAVLAALNAPCWITDPKSGRVAVVALFSAAGLFSVEAVLEFSWRSAYLDALTALPSRRALGDGLSRLGRRYTIAMVDIDHFKRINDRYGHEAGDQMLRFVSTALKQAGLGTVYRYGGEEFAILCPRKTLDHARDKAERLRKRIHDATFRLRAASRPARRPLTRAARKRTSRAKRVPVTVSIGLAQRDETRPTPQDVLDAADQALLKAKRQGRNRVAVG